MADNNMFFIVDQNTFWAEFSNVYWATVLLFYLGRALNLLVITTWTGDPGDQPEATAMAYG